MEVDAGYDGLYSGAGPTPVRVRLTNPGNSVRARVELEAPSQGGRILHFQELDLPQNSSKVITLFPQYDGLATRAEVRVLDGNAVVGKGEDKLARLDNDDLLYGVLAADTSAYAALSNRTGPVEASVALLRPESLPERADALLPLASVIVDGADTSRLSQAQTKALAAWVNLGGQLIIAGGADAARNAAGLSSLMPVSLGGQQNAGDLEALAQLSGGQVAPRGGVITQATPLQGATVGASSPQGPLVVTRSSGQGSVSWLAWSPTAQPFRGWPGTPQLLRNLSGSAGNNAVGRPLDSWTVNRFLSNIAGAQLPPTILVAAFLLVYSLVIGPLLYFILKRRDRRELAWVLVPAITLLFSGIAYGANFLVRGNGVTLRTLEVVDVYPSATAQRVTTYATLFSPSRRSYDLALAPGLSVRGPNPEFDGPMGGPGPSPGSNSGPLFTVQAGERPVLQDLQADVYSLRNFSAQSVSAGQAPVIEATVTGNGTGFSGQVRNVSGAPLDNVYFIDQSGVHEVGPLRPGESGPLDRSTPSLSHGWEGSGPPKDWDRQQIVLGVYDRLMGGGIEGPGPGVAPGGERPVGLAPTDVLVLAWQKQPSAPVSVLDARAQSISDRLTILHSSYELKPGPVELELQAQRMAGFDETDQAEMRFHMPQGVTPDSISLTVRQSGPDEGFGEPIFDDQGNVVGEEAIAMPMPGMPEDFFRGVRKVEVREPGTGAWTDVTPKSSPDGAPIKVEKAARFVDEDGTITMRLTGHPEGPPEWLRLKVIGRKQ